MRADVGYPWVCRKVTSIRSVRAVWLDLGLLHDFIRRAIQGIRCVQFHEPANFGYLFIASASPSHLGGNVKRHMNDDPKGYFEGHLEGPVRGHLKAHHAKDHIAGHLEGQSKGHPADNFRTRVKQQFKTISQSMSSTIPQ